MQLTEAFDLFDLAHVGEHSPSTRTWYRDRFNLYLRGHGHDSDVTAITVNDVRRYRLTLYNREPALSEFTIHSYLRAVKRLYRFLVEEGVIATSPAAAITLPDLEDCFRPKALSDDDLERLLEVSENNARNHAIIRFLATSGARLGGVAGLRVSDIDLDNREAFVDEKGKKVRKVHFDVKTASTLRRYLRERPRVGVRVLFLTLRRPYRALAKSSIQTMLKRLGKRAGCEGPHSPHAFRHRFARKLLEQGITLERVSRLLGHRNIETTEEFYAQWTDSELKAAYDQCKLA